MYEHPEYCYVNYPNIIELTLFSLIFSIYDPNILKLLTIFWIIEFIVDIHHLLLKINLLLKILIWIDYIVVFLSTVIKNIVDFGHTFFHIKKLDFSKLFIRFDWFCKTNKAILNEKKCTK